MRSKFLIFFGAVFGAALATTNSWATLVAYDSFNYSSITTGTAAPSGTPTQTTGGGFTGNWSASASTVSGLSYTSLPTVNNAVSVASANTHESLATSITSGTTYFSFLFKQPGNNGGNISALELVNSTGTGILIGQITANTGTQGGFGIDSVTTYTTTAGNLWTGSNTGDTYGNTFFIVVELVGSGSSWSGTVWINPPAGVSGPGTATATFTTASQFTIAQIAAWNQGGGSAVMDEWRVGTTYADVAGVSSSCTAPTTFTVSGGGAICTPGSTQTINMSGSQTGGVGTNFQYQLLLAGTATGLISNGTGNAITFTGISTQGTYTVLASNTATACTATMSGSAAVTGVTLSPTTLPGGTSGVAYASTTITATNGTKPYTFAVTSGSLPSGLTFSSSTSTSVTLSGTPTVAGSFPVTITATDNVGCVGSQAYTISITAGVLVEYDFTGMAITVTNPGPTTITANV